MQEHTTKEKAILYARFSPRPNAEKCESVEHQLEDLRRYCMENDLQMVDEFSDKACSGADDERPGMWDAINALKKGYTLVVRRFDRLARDSTFALQIIKHQIEEKGAKILSITEPGANGDTADARLIRSILLALAEYNREIIRARTRAAMRRHQRNGRKMSKICPYGWMDHPEDKERIVHNEPERQVIDIIVMYYKQGKKLREIARMLVEKGVRNRTGIKWHHWQIRRILEREGYPPGFDVNAPEVV